MWRIFLIGAKRPVRILTKIFKDFFINNEFLQFCLFLKFIYKLLSSIEAVPSELFEKIENDRYEPIIPSLFRKK